MTDHHESNGTPLVTDRRLSGRHKILFSSVVISETNHGRVLNISPNGLALQTDEELIDDTLPKIRFHFSQSQPCVEARGRIAWRSDSRKVVGVEFIDLTDEVCKQIQTWITSRSDWTESPNTRMSFAQAEKVTCAKANSEISTAIPAPVPEAVGRIAENRSQPPIDSSARSHVEMKDAPTASKNAGEKNIARDIRKTPRFVGLLLAVALLLSVFFLWSHHLQKSGNSQKKTEMTLPPSPPVLPSQPVPSSNSPSVSLSELKPSLGIHAFVLQVGAMVHEENAHALAESLRQENFPAFVVERPADRFHYVLVGPYNSADAAIEVKNELEKRGFRVIRKKWKTTSP